MEWTYYCDVFGGWRWECRDAEGEVRDSQHSYDTRQECMEAAVRIRADALAQRAASESAPNVLAGVAEQHAVQDELRRRADIAAVRAKHSRKAAAEALRDRAREAYDAGGPLVTFEQNWPETIRKLAAKRDLSAS
jgi:hypothetical protein